MKKNKIKKEKTIKKEKKKKRTKKISIGKAILSLILLCCIGIISVILVFGLYIVITAPNFEQKALYQKEPTILYDKYGEEITRIGTKDSTIVTYDELPEVLIDALIATEDSRFFQHNGIDLVRFLKTSFLQLTGRNYAGGASTLSMQVIKNTYTQKGQRESSKLKSLIRKFRDIYMAVFKLEAKFTKEEIIEFYLNSQWFANTGNINVANGIWGVERASEWYFGKSVRDLNLAEASLMVGMFQNTRLYNPYKNPEGCRNRQRTVLKLLVRHGYINEDQKNEILEIPIESMFVDHEGGIQTNINQAFIDYALNDVEKNLKIDPTETSLKIYTTLDPKIQKVLNDVENGNIYKFPNDLVQEGIAITSVENGSIVALSGGRNYQAKGLNRATDIARQPGSTAKPIFEYAMYIEKISKSTYAMLLDEPTTYSNGQRIANYDGRYKGLVTMRYALIDSRNIPALRTFKAVSKIDKKILEDFIHNVGINYGSTLYESSCIGGSTGFSPLEISAAYATFGRGGYYIKPYSYTKVINNETDDEYTYSYTKEKAMEPSTAYMITDILMDVYSARGVKGTQIAGKTGTTNLDNNTRKKYKLPYSAYMDSWYASYSPTYSIALWYGYDKIYNDASAKKYYLYDGGRARNVIMGGVASKTYVKNKRFKVPKSITTSKVELETFPAQLCSDFTPKKKCVSEYFVSGNEPTDISKRYSQLDNPTNGSYIFTGNQITLKWDPINTPEAIDEALLIEHFNKYYEEHANKYYNRRIEYNNNTIGKLGYEVYLKNDDGTEKLLGYTYNSNYTYSTTTGGNYNFIIKSAYSIFKDNKSSGLVINAKANIDTNIEEIIQPNPQQPVLEEPETSETNLN